MADRRDAMRRSSRWRFLAGAAAFGGAAALGYAGPPAVWAQGPAPAAITPDRMRPAIPYGVQSGDVIGDRGVVWSRTDRPARLIVEYATMESFKDARRVVGPAALAESDFTARVDLTELPAGQEIFYRLQFQDLADLKTMSAPVNGRFRTAPAGRRTVSFCFSGDELEVFMLDERSYRGPNSPNRQPVLDRDAAFLGAEQLRWLKRALLDSRATWKVIASDMPISIVVPDPNTDVPKGAYEAWANGDHGAPAGRELELANLLGFIKSNGIRNVVWVTADVHYASATYYNPAKARFVEFEPFWEFVAGPINAGTFGPGEIDQTFGPEVRYKSAPDGMKQNRAPSDGMQYFGRIGIDGATEMMAVTLHDLKGDVIFAVDLDPVRG